MNTKDNSNNGYDILLKQHYSKKGESYKCGNFEKDCEHFCALVRIFINPKFIKE